MCYTRNYKKNSSPPLWNKLEQTTISQEQMTQTTSYADAMRETFKVQYPYQTRQVNTQLPQIQQQQSPNDTKTL